MSTVVHSEMIKTPIPVFGLSGSYAQALYSASIKNKTKDKVATDLNKLGGLWQNQKVSDYMNDPFVPSSKKLGKLDFILILLC